MCRRGEETENQQEVVSIGTKAARGGWKVRLNKHGNPTLLLSMAVRMCVRVFMNTAVVCLHIASFGGAIAVDF